VEPHANIWGTLRKLLLALDEVIKACFKLFFKLLQNSFAPSHVMNQVSRKFVLSFLLCKDFLDNSIVWYNSKFQQSILWKNNLLYMNS
jgi:hypothetical protein